DWIRADVDGDGLAEYVPQSDRAGAREPTRAYSLFATEPSVMSTPKTQHRYLFGGSVYDGWTTVPDKFKVDDPQRPDPTPTPAVIFRFAWGSLRAMAAAAAKSRWHSSPASTWRPRSS